MLIFFRFSFIYTNDIFIIDEQEKIFREFSLEKQKIQFSKEFHHEKIILLNRKLGQFLDSLLFYLIFSVFFVNEKSFDYRPLIHCSRIPKTF